jgi:hypothetical protein
MLASDFWWDFYSVRLIGFCHLLLVQRPCVHGPRYYISEVTPFISQQSTKCLYSHLNGILIRDHDLINLST